MSRLLIKPLTKQDINTKLSLFVYGSTGSGKTYLASTLLDNPNLYPACVLACDNSELTLKPFISENLQVFRADLDVISDVYEHVSSKDNKFKTVFLDNISNLHRVLLENEADKATKEKESNSSPSAKIRSPYKYTMADYGIARAQILTIIDRFLAIPNLNFVVTAWEAVNVDESTSKRTIDPSLAGKLGNEIPGLFDVCMYLYTKEPSLIEQKKAQQIGKELPNSRVAQFVSTNKVPCAKDRSGKLGIEMVDPTIPKIVEVLTS